MKQTLENITTELELMRLKALTDLNSARYASLCNYLGIKPENEDLYSLGLMSEEYSIEFEKADRFYSLIAKEEIKEPKKITEGTFKPFPSNFMYVPTTIKGLKMEIRMLCRKKGVPLPMGFSEMDNKQRKKLYAIYFNMKGINK